MFQDIAPYKLNIGFQSRQAGEHDYLVGYNNNRLLVYDSEELVFPTVSESRQLCGADTARPLFLFETDGRGFFLSPDVLPESGGLQYQDVRILRNKQPGWLSFCGATAAHLARWYENYRFCGKCAAPMLHKQDERALYCPACGRVEYPRINPVVIVGIVDGERLLLVKSGVSEYKSHALVAGFMEIGETLEDTVRREVREEVGLDVRNIRYYKSQPWAFSDSVLVGFFADVDGNTEPYLDGRELSEAVWFHRDEIPAEGNSLSLTWDMIEHFRRNSF